MPVAGSAPSSVAVTVIGYEPSLPTSGLQSIAPVPLPLSVNVQNAGRPVAASVMFCPSGSVALSGILSTSPSVICWSAIGVSTGGAFAVTVSWNWSELLAGTAPSSVAVTVMSVTLASPPTGEQSIAPVGPVASVSVQNAGSPVVVKVMFCPSGSVALSGIFTGVPSPVETSGIGVRVGGALAETVSWNWSESWAGTGALSVAVTVMFETLASPATGLQLIWPAGPVSSVNEQKVGKPVAVNVTLSPSASDALSAILSGTPSPVDWSTIGVRTGGVFAVTVSSNCSESWAGTGASSVTVTVMSVTLASRAWGLQSISPSGPVLSVNVQNAGRLVVENVRTSPASGSAALNAMLIESPSLTDRSAIGVMTGAELAPTVSWNVSSENSGRGPLSVTLTVTIVTEASPACGSQKMLPSGPVLSLTEQKAGRLVAEKVMASPSASDAVSAIFSVEPSATVWLVMFVSAGGVFAATVSSNVSSANFGIRPLSVTRIVMLVTVAVLAPGLQSMLAVVPLLSVNPQNAGSPPGAVHVSVSPTSGSEAVIGIPRAAPSLTD